MNAYTSQAALEAAIDLRSSARKSAFLLAFVEVDGHAWPVSLRNLSSVGALIEAEAGFVVGTRVLFRRAFAAVPSRVVWARGGRFGLRFEDPIAHEDVAALIRRIVPKQPFPNG